MFFSAPPHTYIQYMGEADSALREIAHLLQRLAAADDPTGGGGGAGAGAGEGKGIERLFASLAQHHHARSALRRNKATTARVAPAPIAPETELKMPQHISYAQLHDFLQRHGVHLPSRRFRALVRFVDSDLCGHIDLEDFKALLQADHLFCTTTLHNHPAAARIARLLSQHSLQHSTARVVLRDVGVLLRHGSGMLVEQQDATAEECGEGGEGV
jgi:hypothetical protein